MNDNFGEQMVKLWNLHQQAQCEDMNKWKKISKELATALYAAMEAMEATYQPSNVVFKRCEDAYQAYAKMLKSDDDEKLIKL